MKEYSLGSTLFQAFLAERVITLITRVLADAPMLAILAWDSSFKGLAAAFVIVTPIYFLICVAIVVSSDKALKVGIDLTGLESLRTLENKVLDETMWLRKFIQRILQSRKMIFWIGSWFYLDPDYVTLLLRKREESYLRTFLRITLPSVVISMIVWLGVWWAAVQGFRWAKWALEWVL